MAHRSVLDQVRQAADVDPAQRKVFVHGLGWDTTSEILTAAFSPFGEIEDLKVKLLVTVNVALGRTVYSKNPPAM